NSSSAARAETKTTTRMQCIHCRAWNEEDERRCLRCGRRLYRAAPRPAPDMYPVAGAAAPAFETLPGGRQTPSEPAPANPAAPPDGGFQPSLFRDSTPGPRIMPVPMLTPRPQAGERRTPRPPVRRNPDSQQSLDFLSPSYQDARQDARQESHPLGTEV